MTHQVDNIIKEINRVETLTLNVKKEIKTLKKRIGGYKGWTKRYRKQNQELREEKEKLEIQISQLLSSIQQAKEAKEKGDKARQELNELINKIELYKQVCEKAIKITYADKIYLIQEAERLFFQEEISLEVTETVNSKDNPQMFTDTASINRSLLDK